MGIPVTGGEEIISKRVLGYLKSQEKVLTHLSPKYIVDRTFGPEESEKSLMEIWELSLKILGMPIPLNEEILIETIKTGVQSGTLGLRQDSKVLFKEQVMPDMDSIVVKGEVAAQLIEAEKEEPEPPPYPPPSPGPGVNKEDEKERRAVTKIFHLKASIPWDKLADLVSGVIRPIKDKGDIPRLVVEIEAQSQEGFDRTTLDIKVKETLQQIGAELINWDEK